MSHTELKEKTELDLLRVVASAPAQGYGASLKKMQISKDIQTLILALHKYFKIQFI